MLSDGAEKAYLENHSTEEAQQGKIIMKIGICSTTSRKSNWMSRDMMRVLRPRMSPMFTTNPKQLREIEHWKQPLTKESDD